MIVPDRSPLLREVAAERVRGASDAALQWGLIELAMGGGFGLVRFFAAKEIMARSGPGWKATSRFAGRFIRSRERG